MNSRYSKAAVPRPTAAISAFAWLGILIIAVPVVSLVGFAKRGGHLDGWTGGPADQLAGWTLLTAPTVLIVGIPVGVSFIVAAHLLGVSRRIWLLLAVVLALVTFGLLAYVN
jgi:hypothetical protein